MSTFTPANWSQVKAYDTVVFNVETNPARKPRLRRMVLTGAPHVFTDAAAAEFGMASLVGQHVTKTGARNKAYRNYRDDYVTARIGLVVSVTRNDHDVTREIAAVWDEAHAEDRARTAVADGTARRTPSVPVEDEAAEDEAAAQDIDDWQDPEEGSGVMFFGADGHLVNPEAATFDDEEGWGQPDGMMGRTEVQIAAGEAAAPAPQFPEGTPEYDAYAAELRQELGKWVAGEAPYERPAQPENDMALLRRLVRQSGGTVREISDALIALDRIEAQVPVRATGRTGDALWRHACGWVGEGDGDGGVKSPYICLGANCWSDEPWQAVYTAGSRS